MFGLQQDHPQVRSGRINQRATWNTQLNRISVVLGVEAHLRIAANSRKGEMEGTTVGLLILLEKLVTLAFLI